jgi:hypothetical protein
VNGTAPLASFTVPQFPVPATLVNLSMLVGLGQQSFAAGQVVEVVEVVAVVVVAAFIEVVVVTMGQTAAGCGSHSRMSLSRSFFLGFPRATALTEMVHLLGCAPDFFSFRTRLNSAHPERGPGRVTPARPHFTFTSDLASRVGVQDGLAGSSALAQIRTLNVHEPFGVVTPSTSQLGSQSPHRNVPPLGSTCTTSSKCARHSVVWSMTADAGDPTTARAKESARTDFPLLRCMSGPP